MAKTFLSTDETTYIAGDGTEVFGQVGEESVTLLDGFTGFILDQNIEMISFEGNKADYTFEQQGINLLVKNSLGNVVANITVQSDDDGTQLGFAEGTVSAVFDESNNIVVGVDPFNIEVSIDTGTLSAPEMFDAGTGAFNFTDDADVLNNVVINNFSSDDVITMNNVLENDYSFNNDGTDVNISYNNNGTVNMITLTGVVSAEDLVFDQASFEAKIGFDAFIVA